MILPPPSTITLSINIRVDTPVRNAVVKIGRENSHNSSIEGDEENQDKGSEEEFEGSEEEKSDSEENEDSPNEEEVKHLADLTCRFCNKLFSTKGSRTHHEKYMHQKQKGIECKTPDGACCLKTFSNETSLRYHRLKVHKEAITCHKCRGKFTDFREYLMHRRSELGKPEPSSKVKCDKCEKSISRDHLRRHMKEVHKFPQFNPVQGPVQKQYSCTQCDKQFKREENMRRHNDEVHSAQKSGTNTCEHCGKSFTLERNLKQHLKNAHSPFFSTFKCDLCEKAFKQKGSLNRHKKEKHERDDVFA